MAMWGLASFRRSWKGGVNNHSRGRRGSTFDGAEWDVSGLVWLWQSVLWLVMSMFCWFGYAYKPHPCRHGSRSTREVWDESRLTLASSVAFC